MNAVKVHSNVRIAKQVNDEKTYSINVKKTYTHKEVFNKLLDKLSVHYDVNMHKLVKL